MLIFSCPVQKPKSSGNRLWLEETCLVRVERENLKIEPWNIIIDIYNIIRECSQNLENKVQIEDLDGMYI